MGNPSLGDYIEYLKTHSSDDVLELPGSIPRDFIIMALATELDKLNKPPVVLAKIDGYKEKIVTNIFASRQRIASILGCSIQEISKKWSEIERNMVKPIYISSNVPVQGIIKKGNNVDVTKYPIMQHYLTDAGRYVTSGIVVAKDPDTGVNNLSFHRMQLKGPNKFGISLHSRQHLFNYFEKAESMNKDLEVAVIIGAHPAFLLAASAKPGIDIDEYDIAGSILKEPVELVKGHTVNVHYPSTAEIVLEGKILNGVREPEGPFGEFSGYSTSRSTQNVFEVSAICSREYPYYLNIVPGSAADHLYLARVAREAAILKRLQERIPSVKNICYPRSGVNFHCYLSLSRSQEGVAKQALMLLLGLDHYVKLAIALDDDVNIEDENEVWWAVATRVQAKRDVFIVPNSFIISLDPSSNNGMSDKMAIDATMEERIRNEVVVCRSKPEHEEYAKEILKKIGLD